MLVDKIYTQLQISRVFKDNSSKINSLDFDATGNLLISSSDDETIHLYSCETGNLKKTLFSKRFGVNLIRFTHNRDSVICASRNHSNDECLRYLSLHDNRFLRFFSGHSQRVISLSMSPSDDMFISGSLDSSIRLWDLRVQYCIGVVDCNNRPYACFDPMGIIFATTTSSSEIKLFDIRSYSKGPFSSFNTSHSNEWTHIEFSPDGKLLLLASSTHLLSLDSYTGESIKDYQGHLLARANLQPCFSPDSKTVLCGSADGSIHLWDSLTAQPITQLKGHYDIVRIVKFNPSYMMLASSCINIALWQPKLD